MNNKSDILLSAAGIQLGETLRIVCPTCDGGSTQEKSLVITRSEDGHLVWVCHRATCPTKGGDGGGSIITQSTKKTKKVYTGTTVPLSDSLRERLIELWGVSDPAHWYWSPEYHRLAMSIRSPKYMHRGWVLRDLSGRSKLKALTYIDEGEESLSWYKLNPNAPTVVVEDIPSAVRATMCGVNAVALLGTGVGLSKASEIATHASKPIIVALDQDATTESFRVVMKYRLLWENPEILMLSKDIKNMTSHEVQKLLGSCRCTFAQKMVGDGCEICNPELAKELNEKEGEDA